MVSIFPCVPYRVSVFPCFPYMVMLPNIWTTRPSFWIGPCCGLLWTLHCPKGRYCDVKMIRPLLFHGIRADLSGSPGALITDRQSISYLLDLKAIRCMLPWNNYIQLDAIVGWVNKCSGRRPSDTLLSWWLGWHRHARTCKQLFVKSYDLWFQSVTVILTYVCLYWIKGTLCDYAIRSGRHPSGRQRLGPTCGRDVCLTLSRDHKVFLSSIVAVFDIRALLAQ